MATGRLRHEKERPQAKRPREKDVGPDKLQSLPAAQFDARAVRPPAPRHDEGLPRRSGNAWVDGRRRRTEQISICVIASTSAFASAFRWKTARSTRRTKPCSKCSHRILDWSHLIIAELLKPMETFIGSLGSTLTDQNTLSALNESPTVEASRCQTRTSLCICSGQTNEMYGLCSLKSPNMQLRAN